MDKFGAMRLYRRVVERGSFSAAARDLGLSNAAASKQVAALEAALGSRLLNRTTRRLAPTEAGRAYYERVVRLLDDLAEIEDAVGQLAAAPRGRLRVNAPMSFGLSDLAPLLPAFLERCPDIAIDLVMNDRRVDLIEDGFDVALRIAAELDDSSLLARRIGQVGQLLCAAPSYLDRHGAPATPADLADHDCLLYSLARPLDELRFVTADGGEQRVKVRGRLHANNGDALRPAAVAGLGLWPTPDFLAAEALASGRLVSLSLGPWRLPDSMLVALYAPGHHLSPKVRVFIDYLVETLGKSCRGRTGS